MSLFIFLVFTLLISIVTTHRVLLTTKNVKIRFLKIYFIFSIYYTRHKISARFVTVGIIDNWIAVIAKTTDIVQNKLKKYKKYIKIKEAFMFNN
jgi:hypothetical protein